MNEFIEKNRRLLHFYCVAARTIGWSLLIVAVVVVVVKLFSGFPKYASYMWFHLCQQVTMSFVLLGIVLLGLSQFVRYLYENDYQPGWLLRHGNKVLYLYAVALIISPVLQYYFQMTLIKNANMIFLLQYFLSVVLPAVAKGLIFVGMGHILQRIVPILEESKTLV